MLLISICIHLVFDYHWHLSREYYKLDLLVFLLSWLCNWQCCWYIYHNAMEMVKWIPQALPYACAPLVILHISELHSFLHLCLHLNLHLLFYLNLFLYFHLHLHYYLFVCLFIGFCVWCLQVNHMYLLLLVGMQLSKHLHFIPFVFCRASKNICFSIVFICIYSFRVSFVLPPSCYGCYSVRNSFCSLSIYALHYY